MYGYYESASSPLEDAISAIVVNIFGNLVLGETKIFIAFIFRNSSDDICKDGGGDSSYDGRLQKPRLSKQQPLLIRHSRR